MPLAIPSPSSARPRHTLRYAAAIILPLVFAAATLAQTPPGPPHYNVIQLTRAPLAGTLEASFQNRLPDTLYAIGSQQVPVVNGSGFTVYLNHAVLWSINTGTTELLLPAPLTATSSVEWRGQDINAAGDALITYTDSAQPVADRQRLYVRSYATGQWTRYTITNLTGLSSFAGTAILDNGTVIGTVVPALAGVKPIRWTSASTAEYLPVPTTPAPSPTNPGVTILRSAQNGWLLMQYNNTGGNPAFYVINPAGTVDHVLTPPPGYTGAYQSSPFTINRAGRAYGVAGNSVPPPQRPIRWDLAGQPTDLFNAAINFNYITACNDADWLIGNHNSGTGPDLIIPSVGAYVVNSLVNAGQLPAGVVASTPGVINNNAQMLSFASVRNVILTPDNSCPTITANPPAALSTCGSGTFTLSAAGYAALPITYQWRRNSQIIPGAIGPTYTFTNQPDSARGMYDCLLITTCGNAATTPTTVTIVNHPCGQADIGAQGGVYTSCGDGYLDNNDFVVFISLFFAHDPLADRGIQGGVPGQDGLFDNNDFVVFIDQFFAGC